MRKVKFAFWLIVAGLLGLVFWQNQIFLLEKKGMKIDYFFGNYQFPEIQVVLYFVIFFLAGLLISYFSSLSERFVARKTIKKLKEELARAGIKISELEAASTAGQREETTAKPESGVHPVPADTPSKM
jgi:uncharacterized integral membrane protein